MDDLTWQDLPAWLHTLLIGVLLLVIVSWGRVIRRIWQHKPIIARRLRRRVPWGLDGGICAGLVIVSSLLSLAIIPAEGQSTTKEIDFRLVCYSVSVQLFFLAVSVGILMTNSPQVSPGDFGFTTTLKRLPRDVTFGVLGAAVMLPLVFISLQLLILLFGQPPTHPAIGQLLTDTTLESLGPVILLAVIIAPLFEEFAFRVLLQGGLESKTSRHAWWPIWVSAICFGIPHFDQGFALVSVMVLALGLGYVYRQTHSYVAVVSMHMAFNALSIAYAVGFAQALSAK